MHTVSARTAAKKTTCATRCDKCGMSAARRKVSLTDVASVLGVLDRTGFLVVVVAPGHRNIGRPPRQYES